LKTTLIIPLVDSVQGYVVKSQDLTRSFLSNIRCTAANNTKGNV
jgi:hypothetical protein